MRKIKQWISTHSSYIIIFVAALAASSALGGTVPYGVAAAFLMLPVAAMLLAWIPTRFLRFRHAFDHDSCPRGEGTRYALVISNNGFIPVTFASVRLIFSKDITGGNEEFKMAVGPFKRFRHEMGLIPLHRGIYTLSAGEFLVSDPFRLSTMRGRRPQPLTLTVLPRHIPLNELWRQRLDPQGLGGLFTQNSDEPAVDSRAYRYGDSRRRIHWKLTARQRELMVRQYESLENRRLFCILDLSPFDADDPKSCEDLLIESCLSVVRYALERKISTTLLYGVGSVVRRFSGCDARYIEMLRRDMAAVRFDTRVTMLNMLADIRGAQTLFLFCMNAPDNQTLSALPQDYPVELAVMRTRAGETKLPETLQTMKITMLDPVSGV